MSDIKNTEKVLRLGAAGKARIEQMKKEIPVVKQQIESLSEVLDITPLKDKVEWAEKMINTLEENFT